MLSFKLEMSKSCFTAYTVYIILLNIPINIIEKKTYMTCRCILLIHVFKVDWSYVMN